MSSNARQDFFRLLPRRSFAVFLFAVFFTFAPLGLLMTSAFSPPRPLAEVALSWVLSGLVAVSWALTFTLSRWFAFAIAATSLAQMTAFGTFSEGPAPITPGQPALATLATALAIALGYVLFIVFISRQGQATLRLHTEMVLARQIHETLVPPIQVRRDRLEIVGASRASSEMGGDLIDVVERPASTDVVLADVSGHGVRAGVVMAMMKSALRLGLRGPEEAPVTLARLNDVLDQTTSPEMYATVALMRFHHDASELEYVSAGHHPMLLLRGRSLERLSTAHRPVGLFSGQRYESRRLRLAPGDLLAVYTDGLNEVEDPAGAALGHAAVERAIASRAGEALASIRDAVFDAARMHGAQTDDQTVLLVRVA
jgi:sigma-B regulation protein RsbU (phosphoserine phosphatase)